MVRIIANDIKQQSIVMTLSKAILDASHSKAFKLTEGGLATQSFCFDFNCSYWNNTWRTSGSCRVESTRTIIIRRINFGHVWSCFFHALDEEDAWAEQFLEDQEIEKNHPVTFTLFNYHDGAPPHLFTSSTISLSLLNLNSNFNRFKTFLIYYVKKTIMN